MATSYNPSIVTNGLVLYYDAANTKSYPGSGTVWTDRSSSQNASTLTNASFAGANLGAITFTGANTSYAKTNTVTNITNKDFTVSFWGYSTGAVTSYPTVWSQQGGTVVQFWTCNGAGKTLGVWASGSSILNASASIPYNTWHQGTMTYTNSNKNVQFYLNGVADGASQNLVISFSSLNTSEYIGSWLAGGQNLAGGVGIFQLYNRALSASEIQQNFNAIRRRYNV